MPVDHGSASTFTACYLGWIFFASLLVANVVFFTTKWYRKKRQRSKCFDEYRVNQFCSYMLINAAADLEFQQGRSSCVKFHAKICTCC